MIVKLVKIIKLIRGERGVTGIEYALLVSLVGIAAIVSIQVAGGEVEETFNKVGTTLEDVMEDKPNADNEEDSPDDYGHGCSRRR